MRAQYSTAAVALLLATFAGASCPPGLVATAAAVADLRSVPAPFAPPCRSIAVASLTAELDSKLRRDLPLPPETYIEALVRLGLVAPEGRDAYPRLLEFYASQVLGFYEPSTDEMVLVENPPAAPDAGRLVWAHELAHAAQEHRFGLPTRLLAMHGDSDAQRAASAVAEGDAMLVMFLLASAEAPSAELLAELEHTVQAQARLLQPPPGVPEYFVADLLFPYTVGFTTVVRAHRRGGWQAVDALLAEPPESTAVLLHPDRAPIAGTTMRCPVPPVPPGWSEIVSDTLGEWGLAFWLSRHLPSDEASRLASAWSGDQLRLVSNVAAPERWAAALTLALRDPSREAAAAALAPLLPKMLGTLRRDGTPPEVMVRATPGGLEVLADWPSVGPASQSPPTP